MREAEEHLAGCVNCRARFAEERAVKVLLRERAAMLRTPPMVRGSILAALDATDSCRAPPAPRESLRIVPPTLIASGRFSIRRAGYGWSTAALAAAAVFAFVMLHGGSGTPAHAIPPFDVAIENYEQFVGHFEPNVPVRFARQHLRRLHGT